MDSGDTIPTTSPLRKEAPRAEPLGQVHSAFKNRDLGLEPCTDAIPGSQTQTQPFKDSSERRQDNILLCDKVGAIGVEGAGGLPRSQETASGLVRC